MTQIDYYFATLSPYCYLAGNRLEEVAARHGATIRYIPFDLLAGFPRTGGTPVAERHPSRTDYRDQALLREARKRDMPFNLRPAHWPTNGAPSAYAFIAAQNADTIFAQQWQDLLVEDLILLLDQAMGPLGNFLQCLCLI